MSEALATVSENRFWGCIAPYANRTELVMEICTRLERGEPLAAMCREEGMPSARVVHMWGAADPEIASAIAQSRALGEEAIALEAQEIIDGLRPTPGVPPDANRDKARAEMRLKLLAKFNPRRWGDNLQLRHADAEGAKLDTKELVNELLSLMPGGAPLATGQTLIEGKVKVRNVTPTANAKPVYRPRSLREAEADSGDLV